MEMKCDLVSVRKAVDLYTLPVIVIHPIIRCSGGGGAAAGAVENRMDDVMILWYYYRTCGLDILSFHSQ